jgi:hypothetical protein
MFQKTFILLLSLTVLLGCFTVDIKEPLRAPLGPELNHESILEPQTDTIKIFVGESIFLQTTSPNDSLHWLSSYPDAISVDEEGQVKAHRSGMATIVVEDHVADVFDSVIILAQHQGNDWVVNPQEQGYFNSSGDNLEVQTTLEKAYSFRGALAIVETKDFQSGFGRKKTFFIDRQGNLQGNPKQFNFDPYGRYDVKQSLARISHKHN